MNVRSKKPDARMETTTASALEIRSATAAAAMSETYGTTDVRSVVMPRPNRATAYGARADLRDVSLAGAGVVICVGQARRETEHAEPRSTSEGSRLRHPRGRRRLPSADKRPTRRLDALEPGRRTQALEGVESVGEQRLRLLRAVEAQQRLGPLELDDGDVERKVELAEDPLRPRELLNRVVTRQPR